VKKEKKPKKKILADEEFFSDPQEPIEMHSFFRAKPHVIEFKNYFKHRVLATAHELAQYLMHSGIRVYESEAFLLVTLVRYLVLTTVKKIEIRKLNAAKEFFSKKENEAKVSQLEKKITKLKAALEVQEGRLKGFRAEADKLFGEKPLATGIDFIQGLVRKLAGELIRSGKRVDLQADLVAKRLQKKNHVDPKRAKQIQLLLKQIAKLSINILNKQTQVRHLIDTAIRENNKTRKADLKKRIKTLRFKIFGWGLTKKKLNRQLAKLLKYTEGVNGNDLVNTVKRASHTFQIKAANKKCKCSCLNN